MRSKILAMAGFVLIGGATQASAAILTYTYTGTVSSGYDQTRVFGKAGADLTGETFKVVQTFDTSKYASKYSDGSTASYQYGGLGYGAGGATSVISIGGSAPRSIADTYDYTYSNNYYSGYQNAGAYVEDYHYSYDNAVVNSIYEYTYFYLNSPDISYDYTQPFSLTPSSASLYGSYNFSNYTYNYNNGDYSSTYNYANFAVSSATMTSSLSAVPLPASLPMFGAALLALAGCSLGLSRRGLSNRTSASKAA